MEVARCYRNSENSMNDVNEIILVPVSEIICLYLPDVQGVGWISALKLSKEQASQKFSNINNRQVPSNGVTL